MCREAAAQPGHLGERLVLAETDRRVWQEACALRDAGELSAAADALRRALALDAGNAPAYIALGEISLREQRLEDARSAYQHYLALEPEGEHAAEARAALAGMR